MRKLRIFTAFFLLILFSCTEEEKPASAPKGILPMDSTALVLRDIHELESALMVSSIRQDSTQNLYRALEPDIFRKYKLDTGRFNRSLRYYSSEPYLLDSLYHVVLKKTDSTAIFKP
jgi:hypothetical protein